MNDVTRPGFVLRYFLAGAKAGLEAAARVADDYDGDGLRHDQYTQLGDAATTMADIAAAIRAIDPAALAAARSTSSPEHPAGPSCRWPECATVAGARGGVCGPTYTIMCPQTGQERRSMSDIARPPCGTCDAPATRADGSGEEAP